MNDKQVIAQKIIADAHEKAQKTIILAQEKAETIVDEAKKSADEQVKAVVALASREGELLIERRETIARLDAKKHLLSAKQALVARAFSRAEKLLEGLSSEQYLKLIENQLEKFAETGDCVVLSKNACINEGDVLALEVCKQKGLSVKKIGSFGGGIIIEGLKKDVDLTFKSLTKQAEEIYAGEVARKLFGEND